MTRRAKSDTGAAPFLKWAGGKAQLLGEILERLPERISGTYHEPFVGGGAVFFRLKALGKIKRAVLSDVNRDLMTAYQMLRDAPEAVLAELEALAGRTSEADFYELRAQDPDAMTAAQRTARLIYLNKTGFNGLYRVNSKGHFNVPYGRYAKPKILDRENLLRVHQALVGAGLEQGSFTAVLERAKAGDLVYFDPPYQPVSKTASFTAYAKGGFAGEDQELLASVVRELSHQGVEVLVSNSDTPLIRRLYAQEGWRVDQVKAVRAINSKGSGRGAVDELLIRVPARRRRKAAASRAPASQLSIAFKE